MRFNPPLWAWVLTLAGLALFLALGHWQLDRGTQKQAWLEQFDELPRQTPRPLSARTPAPDSSVHVHVQATGRYLPERQLLADGQSREGRPGYHVWTPLRLLGGGLVLVNRGWVPQPAPEVSDVPPGELAVTGYWRSLPEPGLRLQAPDCAPPARFPAVVVYPDAEQIGCLLGEPVVTGILLLAPDEPGGYVREWAVVGLPPERHFGYATQWFALALTAVVLFVVLNLKRNS